MLQKLSKEQLSAKIGQIEDWALALAIDESRELDRCRRLHVLSTSTPATDSAAVTKSVSSESSGAN
jgi:hypothetical protein